MGNKSDIITVPENLRAAFEALPEEEKMEMMKYNNDLELRDLILAVKAQYPADIASAAKDQASEAHQLIVSSTTNEQLKLFSPFPTELTRCSPFFPLSTQDMKERKYIEDLVIADHSWGQIRFTGQKLSVYEEDLLMVLLAAIHERGLRSIAKYTYADSMTHLLNLKGIQNPGQNHREEAYASLKRMASATFELDTSPRSGQGKKRGGKTIVNNIIANLSYDRKAGILIVTVNPYFYEMFCQGEVTWLDIRIRMRLKSPVAKALHRFVMSHQKDFWTGPVVTLAEALNLDLALPKIKIRERLKKAIADLIAVVVLRPTSGIQTNTATLNRVPRGTSPPKRIETDHG